LVSGPIRWPMCPLHLRFTSTGWNH